MATFKSFSKLTLIVLIGIALYSCSSPGNSWSGSVPEETAFLIIPESGATVQSVIQSDYMPFLEDISSAAVQLVAEIDSNATESMPLHSILMYPGNSQNIQPIWVTRAPDNFLETIKNKYARDFSRNEYKFRDVTILSLKIQNREFFLTSFDDFMVMSESSYGIENMIRVYQGSRRGADLSDVELAPGSIILNTPAMDTWASQMTRVRYHPLINNALQGTAPASLTIVNTQDEQERALQFTGTIPITDDKSSMITALSHANKAITLDEYISSNVAAFGIFHRPAPTELTTELPDTTDSDIFLMNDSDRFAEIAKNLDSEFAIAMYAESGFLSSGEYLFLRKLQNPAAFRRQLESLASQDALTAVDNVYFAQSYALSQLLGSPLCNFKDFYINIVDDVAVISKRKGLTELVESDRNRRRVIYYEPFYENIKTGFPDQPSSVFVAGPDFNSYLAPYLTNGGAVQAITASFDYLSFSAQVDEAGENLSITLSTFNLEDQNQPFRENWFYNVGDAELSGPPVFANIGGSLDKEAVFATKNGTVYAISSDGTLLRQFRTDDDIPIGSPVVYDWYGSGRNVILQAAGDKIYGWDENGELLPKFPFRLTERITTPLSVTDLNGNRIPDAIVATADRRLHVLDGRGNNLAGWPVTTNAPINSKPYVGDYQNRKAVVAYSSNAVHAWDATGNLFPGFPQFINASFQGSPAKFKESLLGGAVDGNVYAIGPAIPFADSLNVYNSSSGSAPAVKALSVSNNPLVGAPDTNDGQVLATAQNGSVFLMNEKGALQLTKNMGQPSAQSWPARLVDIDGNGTDDIVALASYGRLYAWQISTGERIFNLPTTGMRHVQIGDLDGDGLTDIVAQTDEGVQSWTINR